MSTFLLLYSDATAGIEDAQIVRRIQWPRIKFGWRIDLAVGRRLR